SESDSVDAGAAPASSAPRVPMPIRVSGREFRCKPHRLSPFAHTRTLIDWEAHMNIERLTTPWWALRVVLGAIAFLAGLDKFFNLLADWPAYLSPTVRSLLPISLPTFMHIVGIVEMAVGVVILAGYTRLGGYIAAAWLLCIAVDLVTTGRYLDV